MLLIKKKGNSYIDFIVNRNLINKFFLNCYKYLNEASNLYILLVIILYNFLN